MRERTLLIIILLLLTPLLVAGTASEVNVGDGPPKFAVINGGAGDLTVVAAVSGKKIRVMSYNLTCGASATARFESTAGGTALTGIMPCGASNQITVDYNPMGHFETADGALLNLEIGTADIDGHLTYVEVD